MAILAVEVDGGMATELGVSRATLSEHLRVAQGKLLDALFDQPVLGTDDERWSEERRME